MVFVIEELYLDPTENDSSSAIEYRPIGYYKTLSDAEKYTIDNGRRFFTQDDCWAISRDKSLPKFLITQLPELKIN